MSGKDFSIAAGDVIGNYVIIRELGRGNNGVVYLARQRILERLVACKVLLPENMEEPGYAEAFFREARTAAQISHPNIVQALDVGNDNGKCFFVMEFVDGEMLEDIRKNSPERLTPKFLLTTAIQLATALEYAWNSCRMIHGDIKPENIMIQNNGSGAKLADLGLARIAGNQSSDIIMATPLYVAPEIITQTGEADPRSDIYSFGVMLYELSCGEPPFNGPMEELLQKHISERPEPILQRNPDMNMNLAALIDRTLAKSPDDRPQSWHEIRKTLELIQKEMYPDKRENAGNLAIAEKNEKKRPSSMPQWAIMLFAMAAAFAVLMIIILLQKIFNSPRTPDPIPIVQLEPTQKPAGQE